MFGAILKATNSSFQKGMAFCWNIYVKQVIKRLAFIFEQLSYNIQRPTNDISEEYHKVCEYEQEMPQSQTKDQPMVEEELKNVKSDKKFRIQQK